MKPNIDTHGVVQFEDIVEGRPKKIVDIARALRTRIAKLNPGVVEVCWPNQGIASYGVGPRKMSEHYCYVAPHKAHVNLGFYYGADLDDPTGRLEGGGKALRHVKVRTTKDASSADLRDLVRRAAGHLPKI